MFSNLEPIIDSGLDGIDRPVLKHGPRSVDYARVLGPTKPKGEMKVSIHLKPD